MSVKRLKSGADYFLNLKLTLFRSKTEQPGTHNPSVLLGSDRKTDESSGGQLTEKVKTAARWLYNDLP